MTDDYPAAPDQRSRACVRAGLVLAAFDGSTGGLNALAYACGLAERTDAHLVVLYVESGVGLGYTAAGPAHLEWVSRETTDAIGAAQCSVEIMVGTGDPAAVIGETARHLKADAVVVGRSRHPCLHPLGSVPGQVVRRSACPVLVIP